MDKTNIDDVYLNMISKEAEKIAEKFSENGSLTPNEIHTLVLKTQYNHINHLDKKLDEVTDSVKSLENKFTLMEEKSDRRFSEMELKIDKVKISIETKLEKAINTQTKWIIGSAGAMIVILKLLDKLL